MVQFTKLRLSGFKSFVDPAELLIEPGLTGIVGPNGCGKSNLLEALRWTMGEGSARQMRGGEMDDVIFGGARGQPPRNIAEVVIVLDNSRRDAPASFNNHDELEVVRRIERGSGSSYRVNGTEMRARDVQLLFADISTGARSTAIVSQGRVAALIDARPIDRRLLLEEAAGITGLHTRRHEAELRLNAADTNLTRLDDVLTAIEGQLQGLKRQARQASRYRNLSDHIRRAEALQLHLKWSVAAEALAAAEARLADGAALVAERTRTAGAAAGAQAEAAAPQPELREEEAAAGAEFGKLVVAREALDAEESRLNMARQEYEKRLEQIAADIDRETGFLEEAKVALGRLGKAQASLRGAQADEAAAEAAAAESAAGAADEVDALEPELTRLTEKIAADEARQADLARRLAEIDARIARLAERAAAAAAEREGLGDGSAEDSALAEADAAVARARKRLDRAKSETAAAEGARAEAEAAEALARDERQRADEARARLKAEVDGLRALLGADETDWPPVIDEVAVEPGYEAALAAALGDDLSAATDTDAPMHWAVRAAAEDPSLPDGAETLAGFVEAPPALRRRLRQIGVVEDAKTARALARRLSPGQRLVTRKGGLWRWDGFTVVPGAQTAAATRLEQRNRLVELGAALDEAERRAGEADGRHAEARADAEGAGGAARAARQDVDEAFAELGAASEARARAAETAGANAWRIAALADAAGRLQADLEEAAAERALADAAGGDIEPSDDDRARLTVLRQDLAAKRAALADHRRVHDRLAAEAEARHERLSALEADVDSWRTRIENGNGQLARLEARRDAAAAELERLAARPDEIGAQREALADSIAAAERTRNTALDRLAEAESALADLDRKLRSAEAVLADAREERGRCEGLVKQAEAALETLVERIAERLRSVPEEVLALAEVKDPDDLPGLESVETRLERLVRERENMGPVNLRAETEASELQQQMDSLVGERSDLIAAIARLREAIAKLNREGRERLLASFDDVNTHFQELFVRLFGGGRAHLKLTESDDPLEAGLEVMASPPGKRLQTLSLLSGGEQALTALALLFGVFLTNPAPVCILDEVDAPLDDANVDRFCTLLEDIVRDSATRFLLITHHRMTMARMDRLFGVTMAESGVSRLVSVDLQRAEDMRATA